MRSRVELTVTLAVVSAVLLTGARTPRAQSSWASQGPVVYGHHHLNITDRGAHERFWGTVLGGVRTAWPGKNIMVFKFPNTLVFLTDRAPSGGTIGSTVNHIGFWVPNTRAMVDRVRSAGFRVITARELPNAKVQDGVVCSESQKTCVAYVLGPDAVKVEIVENRSQTIPIQNHHIHFHTPHVDELRGWYVETFGGVAGMNPPFKVVDLPGVNIRFSESSGSVAGTEGRSLDHVGFEIDNLEAFCRRLEAKGIKFDRPYSRRDDLKIGFAFLTDPNGTRIELTEGLDNY
jgi:catechol 2,3-dioxygenase-like lactoylglutathione lyase family enzyme